MADPDEGSHVILKIENDRIQGLKKRGYRRGETTRTLYKD
jgi:hypothetical protein